MSLFEHFFKVLSLSLKARIRIPVQDPNTHPGKNSDPDPYQSDKSDPDQQHCLIPPR
jgi:hypothetical protein